MKIIARILLGILLVSAMACQNNGEKTKDKPSKKIKRIETLILDSELDSAGNAIKGQFIDSNYKYFDQQGNLLSFRYLMESEFAQDSFVYDAKGKLVSFVEFGSPFKVSYFEKKGKTYQIECAYMVNEPGDTSFSKNCDTIVWSSSNKKLYERSRRLAMNFDQYERIISERIDSNEYTYVYEYNPDSTVKSSTKMFNGKQFGIFVYKAYDENKNWTERWEYEGDMKKPLTIKVRNIWYY